MRDVKTCEDCGKQLVKQTARWCKSHSYKHRTRPTGLKYNIVAQNKGWFPKGHKLTVGRKLSLETRKKMSEMRKGIHSSPKTEFKYKNGNGYRHLLYKKVLPQYCQACLDEPGLKRLHVHHKDRDRTNNNLDNLLVLCRPCHLSEHGKQERVYVEGRKAV